MWFEIVKSFDDYISIGGSASEELLRGNGPTVQVMRVYSQFFERRLWIGEVDVSPNVGLLSMNAYMLLLAAMRMALSGHSAAVFPLLRTSLESACYAFMMAREPATEAIWMNRHESRTSRDRCRKRFGSATSFTARQLNRIQDGSGDMVVEGYDLVIDDGAHPNPKSVFRRIQFLEDQGDAFVHMHFNGIYWAGAHETTRSLVTCLDIALVVAIVCARSLKDLTKDTGDELNRVNDLKDRLVEELNGEEA